MSTLESIRSIAERFMKKFERTPMKPASPIDYEFHCNYHPDEGWMDWNVTSPLPECSDCMIEVARPGWKTSKMIFVTLIYFESSTSGLRWRKTGIYKQREEEEYVRGIADRLLGKKQETYGGQVRSAQVAKGINRTLQQKLNSLGGLHGASGGLVGYGGLSGLNTSSIIMTSNERCEITERQIAEMLKS